MNRLVNGALAALILLCAVGDVMAADVKPLGNVGGAVRPFHTGETVPILNGGTGATTTSGIRTALGLVIGTNVQAYDADLTTYAGITPSANVQALLASVNYAGFRTSLDVYSKGEVDTAVAAATTPPGGSSGQIQYNTGSGFGGFTASGDATINTGTGAVAVTKTGGVSFAASATTDTTSASNISAGSLALGRIATIGANTVLGNGTGSTAVPTALSVPNCSTSVSALNWTSATGFTCGTHGTFADQNYATPPSIGATTPAAGKFTTLQATSTLTTAVTGSTQCLQVNSSGTLSGTGAACGGSSGAVGQNKLTILQRTTTQTITSNSWTAISWDTSAVQDDVGAFSSGSPTLWTVPSGYTKMRLLVYTVWFNNSSGTARSARLDKNGSTTIDVDMRPAINEAGAHWETRWYTVTAGDTYQILILHTVGVNLNACTTSAFGSPCYVQVEWAP